jgi:outer membrane protein TolC
MKNSLRYLLIALFTLSYSVKLNAQDSIRLMYPDDFLNIVMAYHPVMKQARLISQQGSATVQEARGNFDPYLYGKLDEKGYDNKEYYSLLSGGVKVPTWYGIAVKAGYEQNDGVFLNPENQVPTQGLMQAGVSVTLGKGLFMDERRATLRKAQLFEQRSYEEQRMELNDLTFDALKHYWKWVATWNKTKVYENALELTKTRFEAIKLGYELGDLPAIDTLEVFIQVQNFTLKVAEEQLAYRQATIALSNFLWSENNLPMVITDRLNPPDIKGFNNTPLFSGDSLQSLLDGLAEQHPMLKMLNYEVQAAEIERSLNREGLKPVVNLNYNALSEPVGDEFSRNLSSSDYKFGLEIGFPLFLRTERAKLKMTGLKLTDLSLEQESRLLALQNTLKQYYTQQERLQLQIELYADVVDNTRAMLAGEQRKFDAGESAVFVLNSREMNVVLAELKRIELQAEYFMAQAGMIWSAGGVWE